jgi:hypothetical protein
MRVELVGGEDSERKTRRTVDLEFVVARLSLLKVPKELHFVNLLHWRAGFGKTKARVRAAKRYGHLPHHPPRPRACSISRERQHSPPAVLVAGVFKVAIDDESKTSTRQYPTTNTGSGREEIRRCRRGQRGGTPLQRQRGRPRSFRPLLTPHPPVPSNTVHSVTQADAHAGLLTVEASSAPQWCAQMYVRKSVSMLCTALVRAEVHQDEILSVCAPLRVHLPPSQCSRWGAEEATFAMPAA